MSLSNVISLAVILSIFAVALSAKVDSESVSVGLSGNGSISGNFPWIFQEEHVLYVSAEVHVINSTTNANATVGVSILTNTLDSFNVTANTTSTTILKAYGPCHFKQVNDTKWSAKLLSQVPAYDKKLVAQTNITLAYVSAFELPVDNTFNFTMNSYGAFLYLTVPPSGLNSFTISLNSDKDLPISGYQFSQPNSCNSTTHTISAGTRSFTSSEFSVQANNTYYITFLPSADFSGYQTVTVTTAAPVTAHGLSTGAIVGIVIGSIAGVVISFIIIYMVVRSNKKPEHTALLRN